MKHDIGIAGLAVMGENLVLNIESKGFSVAVFNRTYSKTENFINGRANGKEITGFHNIGDFINSLDTPKKIMMMVKAGDPVDQFIEQLLPFLEEGDIIIDGGNSHFHDTIRRVEYLEKKNIRFIGTGVSGGEEGALKGPSIMPGGSVSAWQHVEPLFLAASAEIPDGSKCCAWIGPGGAGHFVKMIHNGIEYGDMQLICEAYHFMKSVLTMSLSEMHAVFSKWNSGELGSYLIEITSEITAHVEEDGTPTLDVILDAAGQKGTGKWTVITALDRGVPLSLISESVFARCLSSQKELRLEASRKLEGPSESVAQKNSELLKHLGKALYGAKLISYAQGFNLMKLVSDEENWNLNLAEIARIWRGGCIIRSAFLDKISDAYSENPLLANMLFDPFFQKTIIGAQKSLREIITAGIKSGIPLPCHTSALCYYDGLRAANLPANLLQAQRDFFGAHMYERIDMPRGKWFHTDWTGEGGNTTSTAYSK